jgi:5-formyltetrahydrofolate cyclo-ligase
MESWEAIRSWRRSMRTDLRARRMAAPRSEREHIGSVLTDLLWDRFRELRDGCIGFYWPFNGEADLRGLVGDALALGAEAALPVVVEKQQPLEFRAWRPGTKLERGIWNIPIPAERNLVKPTVLLVPLVGFDRAGYRLGYGGGYYDRTLASMNPRPLTIGVGYELGRLETIYPQPHDIPLDAIVTEAGYARHRWRGLPLSGAGHSDDVAGHAGPTPGHATGRRAGAVEGASPAGDECDAEDEAEGSSYASPPCFMHELDPSYLGYASVAESILLLNELLGAGPAIAASTAQPPGAGAPGAATLSGMSKDEAGFDAMLRRHIARLGGRPDAEPSSFHELSPGADSPEAKCELSGRGQAAVIRKLQTALPRIGDRALYSDLKQMLETLERRIEGRGGPR